MTDFGYTMMCEQSRPDQLVRDLQASAGAGFDFSVISDGAVWRLACGPDVEAQVETVHPFIDVGFTEIALVQNGGEHQPPFIEWAERELLPALRSL